MPETWRAAKGRDVRPGDKVRTPDGSELTVTRIEPQFFGIEDLIAFIEDTPQRWFKRPARLDGDVEILIEP